MCWLRLPQKRQTEYPPHYRSNQRLLVRSQELADLLWRRLQQQGALLEAMRGCRPFGFGNEGEWEPVRLNECFKVSPRLGSGGGREGGVCAVDYRGRVGAFFTQPAPSGNTRPRRRTTSTLSLSLPPLPVVLLWLAAAVLQVHSRHQVWMPSGRVLRCIGGRAVRVHAHDVSERPGRL